VANPSKSPDDDDEEEEDNTHTRRLSKKKKKHTTTKRPPSPPPPLPPPRRLFPGVVVMVGRTPKERVSFSCTLKSGCVFPVQLKKVKERDDICLGSRGWLKKKRGGGGVSKKRKVENPIEQKKKRVTFHARTRNNNSKQMFALSSTVATRAVRRSIRLSRDAVVRFRF